MNNKELKQIPLYKNHIFLLAIFLPCFAVIGCFITLFLAIKSSHSGVLEGFYKYGLAPRKKAETAISKNINAIIEKGILEIKANLNFTEPLILKLEHPSLEKEDRYFELNTERANIYPLNPQIMPLLNKQRYYLKLYDKKETWQIKGVSSPELEKIALKNHYE